MLTTTTASAQLSKRTPTTTTASAQLSKRTLTPSKLNAHNQTTTPEKTPPEKTPPSIHTRHHLIHLRHALLPILLPITLPPNPHKNHIHRSLRATNLVSRLLHTIRLKDAQNLLHLLHNAVLHIPAERGLLMAIRHTRLLRTRISLSIGSDVREQLPARLLDSLLQLRLTPHRFGYHYSHLSKLIRQRVQRVLYIHDTLLQGEQIAIPLLYP